MKTKLLRKIRKNYSIIHYPKGNPQSTLVEYRDKECWELISSNIWECYVKDSYGKVMNILKKIIKRKYSKYTRMYKQRLLLKQKVWYVGKEK